MVKFDVKSLFDEEFIELITDLETQITAGEKVEVKNSIRTQKELKQIMATYNYVLKTHNILVCFEYDGWTLFELKLQ